MRLHAQIHQSAYRVTVESLVLMSKPLQGVFQLKRASQPAARNRLTIPRAAALAATGATTAAGQRKVLDCRLRRRHQITNKINDGIAVLVGIQPLLHHLPGPPSATAVPYAQSHLGIGLA